LSGQTVEIKKVAEFPKANAITMVYHPLAVPELFPKIIYKPYYVGLPKQDHLPGFFCKMEYKMEAKSKLSPRFRLGSLNYTNWMEGKGELYSRYWK